MVRDGQAVEIIQKLKLLPLPEETAGKPVIGLLLEKSAACGTVEDISQWVAPGENP